MSSLVVVTAVLVVCVNTGVFFVVVWVRRHVVMIMVVVQRVKLSVVALMVVHVVVFDDDVAKTEALQQVLEAFERYSAAAAFAVLVEQTSQGLPGRVSLLLGNLVKKSVELVVRLYIRDDRRCQYQRQRQRWQHLYCICSWTSHETD